MKEKTIGIIAIIVLFLFLKKILFGPTPCDCSDVFYYAKEYPLATNSEDIDDCMKLYFEEKKIDKQGDYNSTEYFEASYYFMNHDDHPCK